MVASLPLPRHDMPRQPALHDVPQPADDLDHGEVEQRRVEIDAQVEGAREGEARRAHQVEQGDEGRDRG